MISGLYIKKFRCFEAIEISNLAPITIFGGKNNVGKSSVLEALLLQNVFLMPNYFAFLMNLHNEAFTKNTKPSKIWDQLFYNTYQSDDFEIGYERPLINEDNKYDDHENGVAKKDLSVIKVKKNLNNFGVFQNGAAGSLLNQEYAADPLKQSVYSSLHIEIDSRSYKNSGNCFIYTDGIMFYPENMKDNSGMSVNPQKGPLWPFENMVIFKNVFSNSQSTAEWLSKVNLNEEKRKILIETMKLFEPDISSISTVIDQGVSSVYVTLKSGDSEKIISANYMGDGFNKVFQLLLTIMTLPNGILFIDEFENGLHYELYDEVLTSLFKTALTLNCQIVMTTHNRDLVESALLSMKKLKAEDKLCYQRLDFVDGQHKTVVYQGKELELPFKANLEIR